MRAKLSHLIIFFVLLLISTPAFSQQDSGLFHQLLSLPDKVFGNLDRQSQKLNQQLDKQTEKYLSKLEKQEQKLKRKLWRTDSLKAKELFGDVQERYNKFRSHLTNDTIAQVSTIYNASSDSLSTLLNFVNKPTFKKPSRVFEQTVESNLKNITALKNKFNQTEEIRKQLKARQEQLRQQLNNTPLAKELAKFKKQTYYYQAQLKEYREALNDPTFMGTKLIEIARKIPSFQKFFNQHSELAGLFALPGSSTSADFLNNTALQTRTQVTQLIQTQFSGTNVNPQQYIQSNLAGAQSQLNSLKRRFEEFSASNNNEEMPDFKPNDQKTKSLKDRLVVGTNFQTTSTRTYFPVTTDFGLSLGYKLNSKSIIGFGGAYKLGLGTGFNNISLTHQGIGFRSFIDWKIKGNFWVSGGYEQNYLAAFRRMEDLNNPIIWKQSAIIGVSKTVDVKSKFFKKMKVQLLYDFLWRSQLPQTQPVLFRVGYNF